MKYQSYVYMTSYVSIGLWRNLCYPLQPVHNYFLSWNIIQSNYDPQSQLTNNKQMSVELTETIKVAASGAGIDVADISLSAATAMSAVLGAGVGSLDDIKDKVQELAADAVGDKLKDAAETAMEAVPDAVKHHPLFETALKSLKEKLGDIELSPASLTKVMRAAMEIIEDLPVKGIAQKELALDLLRQVVTDSPLEDIQKKLCQDVIESGILGNTIDLVVAASKGELSLNRAAEMAADVAYAAASRWPCCATIATLLRSASGGKMPSPPAIRRRRH